nr:protein FAR1-related sequence 11 [Tanacetum cinerariifolium]
MELGLPVEVDLAIEEIEKAEVHNKILSKLIHPSLKGKSPLEEQAVEVLTPYAFKRFQEEFKRASRYLVVHNSAKDNEISMDETSINHEDILLDEMPDAENDILCPPKSIPKGRARKRRKKGEKETTTKWQNKCSLCKQRGHTRPKYPEKDNTLFMVDDATSTSQKKKRCLPHNAWLNPVFNLKY